MTRSEAKSVILAVLLIMVVALLMPFTVNAGGDKHKHREHDRKEYHHKKERPQECKVETKVEYREKEVEKEVIKWKTKVKKEIVYVDKIVYVPKYIEKEKILYIDRPVYITPTTTTSTVPLKDLPYTGYPQDNPWQWIFDLHW